jgi:hypothetical protein
VPEEVDDDDVVGVLARLDDVAQVEIESNI